jgi:hypothetical protein
MTHPAHNPPESGPPGHETGDPPPLPVVIFVAALIVTLVLVHLVGWGAYRWLQEDRELRNHANFPPSALAAEMPAVPPDPRLEPEPSRDVLPRVDLQEVQAKERAMIGQNNWGWLDSSHQFARVPLQQAMDMAVEHGLPEALPATQPSQGPFMPPASALHGPGGVP